MSIPTLIVTVWLGVILGVVALCLLAEGLFWCFCWCFCRVDDYFRERYMRIIMENIDRLDRIAKGTD